MYQEPPKHIGTLLIRFTPIIALSSAQTSIAVHICDCFPGSVDILEVKSNRT